MLLILYVSGNVTDSIDTNMINVGFFFKYLSVSTLISVMLPFLLYALENISVKLRIER